MDRSRPTVTGGRTISPSRALTTLVYYPQVSGRRPLVVFGPGYDVGPEAYQTLLQTWAAHGYVVAAVEFPLADPDVAGANGVDENDINNEPQDVRFVTDWMVSSADPILARIDTSRVAITGHSDGAEVAVAAAENPTPSGEPGFRAVVAMSAQEVPGQHGPWPPILVTQGDADDINPPSNSYQLYSDATAPKYLLVLHGGGHLPPLQAGSQWLAGVEAVTEAFLDTYLVGTGPSSAIASAATAAGGNLMSLQRSP